MTAAQLLSMLESVPEICAEHRSAVSSALSSGQWGQFYYSSPGLKGKHDSSHLRQFHYGINSIHPGFTGVLDGTPIGPAAMKVQLAGTMVHEWLHHTNPGVTDSQGIDYLTEACVPTYVK